MDPFSPYATTGLSPMNSSPSSWALGAPAINSSSGPSAISQTPSFHPDHPLFWVAGLLAVTFGLIAANGSIRFGKFKASAGAGK